MQIRLRFETLAVRLCVIFSFKGTINCIFIRELLTTNCIKFVLAF